jgi:hypothetical protein
LIGVALVAARRRPDGRRRTGEGSWRREQGILQGARPTTRSRVIGASESAILIALAISFAFGGEVVDSIGPRGAYFVGTELPVSGPGARARWAASTGTPPCGTSRPRATPLRPERSLSAQLASRPHPPSGQRSAEGI